MTVNLAELEKQIDMDLALGKITEEEWKRKMDIIKRIKKLDEDLIYGRITEAEYKSKREALISQLQPPGAPTTYPSTPPPPATPTPPPTPVQPPLYANIQKLLSELETIKSKRSKLSDLLISKEISEKTFNKIDGELESREKELEEKLKSLKSEVEERIEKLSSELEELTLELEEALARWKIGDITEAEYNRKKSELEARKNMVEAELETLKKAAIE